VPENVYPRIGEGKEPKEKVRGKFFPLASKRLSVISLMQIRAVFTAIAAVRR